MIGRSLPAGCPVAAVLGTIDRRFVLHTALWAVASLLAFGLVTAIIPNPVFGRQIPPQPFAIVVWFASAALMGLLGATYSAAAPSGLVAESVPLLAGPAAGVAGRDGTTLGTVASLARAPCRHAGLAVSATRPWRSLRQVIHLTPRTVSHRCEQPLQSWIRHDAPAGRGFVPWR